MNARSICEYSNPAFLRKIYETKMRSPSKIGTDRCHWMEILKHFQKLSLAYNVRVTWCLYDSNQATCL
eukprot:UN23919